jgi:hypothetical protein
LQALDASVHRSVSASLVVAAETTNTLLSFRFEGQENLLDQISSACFDSMAGRTAGGISGFFISDAETERSREAVPSIWRREKVAARW